MRARSAPHRARRAPDPLARADLPTSPASKTRCDRWACYICQNSSSPLRPLRRRRREHVKSRQPVAQRRGVSTRCGRRPRVQNDRASFWVVPLVSSPHLRSRLGESIALRGSSTDARNGIRRGSRSGARRIPLLTPDAEPRNARRPLPLRTQEGPSQRRSNVERLFSRHAISAALIAGSPSIAFEWLNP